MKKKNLSKLLALYLPYVVIGLLATNLGEAWRLAVGKELGDKIVSLMGTLPVAFANPLPSLHPFDLFIGLCCGAGMRLAVYLKSKNSKKYRHGMEYGSARWGGPKDIEPFMAPKFEDNAVVSRIVPIQSILDLIRIHTSGRVYAFHKPVGSQIMVSILLMVFWLSAALLPIFSFIRKKASKGDIL